MHTRDKLLAVALVAGLSVPLAACTQFGMLKAKKAFKEANSLYSRQEYSAAAEKYEEVLQDDPNLTTAYFYLGNSYDNLYRPSRAGEPENDAYLKKAVDNYQLAADRETDPAMKKLAMQYLIASYGPEKLNDPSSAEPIVRTMIELEPTEAGNYFVLAKIYEDSGRYEDAELTLQNAQSARPNDPAVYMQLAGFYNRQGEFDKTIVALEQRASKEPNNPEAYYTIATFFWEKAFRDFRITDEEKKDYVLKGLEAVDKAIDLNADYMEALVYKNILLRMEANMETNQERQQALIKEADTLRDRAEELRKQKAAGVAEP